MKKGRPSLRKPVPQNPQSKLITIYKLTYPGARVIQQYYQWDFGDRSEDTLYVDSCPGCGKNLKYKYYDHKCDGSLTSHPLDNKMRKVSGIQTIDHYISQQNHPIITSD